MSIKKHISSFVLPGFVVIKFFLILSLPNDKILNRLKSKAFADDKINVTEKLKSVLGMLENIVGKEENDGYQHFLLYPQCFLKNFKVANSQDCVVKS